jgi:hypothetical protein
VRSLDLAGKLVTIDAAATTPAGAWQSLGDD